MANNQVKQLKGKVSWITQDLDDDDDDDDDDDEDEDQETIIMDVSFTCAVSSITLVTFYTAADIRSFSVGTQSIGVTFICFRTCTLIQI